MALTSRDRLLATLSMAGRVAPPRFENEFSDGVIELWRSQGFLDERPVEERFGLDRCETVPIEWGRLDNNAVVQTEAGLEPFLRQYDASRPTRFPEDWDQLVASWRARDYALRAAPWSEGLFQVMGVSNGVTFNRAMFVLREQPRLVEALMDRYADFLETLIPRVLATVPIDYALFYEPIAWTRAPVISPEDYARFALPALRRVIAALDTCGVEHRILRATGEVRPLIPLWLDAGINGLMINQIAATGIHYPALRREFGRDLRLLGGIDWRAVVEGPAAIDQALDEAVLPLLDEGGYIPHLDDTVRVTCPFDHFNYYRDRLNKLIAEMEQ